MSKYTEDQVDYMIRQYRSAGVAPEGQDARDDVMKELAKSLGTSIPSIRQILVNRKIYIKKKYRTKRGTVPINKEDLIIRMEKYFHTFPGFFESFDKANKTTLAFVMAWIIERLGDNKELFKDVL